MSAARLATIRKHFDARGIDGLLVTRPENRRWLSGVTAEDASPTAVGGWLIVGTERAEFVTTGLYHGQALSEADGVEVVLAQGKLHETVAARIEALGVRHLGFDPTWLTVRAHADLTSALPDGISARGVEGLIEPHRQVKDDAELVAIRKAVAISDGALIALWEDMKPGMTEAEAAWLLEAHMRTHGADGMAFEPGVASGPNAAVPHHKPGNRAIRAGEPVWIDIGARVDGYLSDVTRSFVLGRADDEYRRLWDEVLEAQSLVLDYLRPGRSGRECDLLARARLGDRFIHGLGHGVGLEIHEAPWMTRFRDDVLLEGSVVTVEPGAYTAGWGGIRHEQLVVVRRDGPEVLTTAPMPIVL